MKLNSSTGAWDSHSSSSTGCSTGIHSIPAVGTSLRVMRANPTVIAAWGLIVAVLLVIGSLPLLLGLAIVLPVLGHATWHLYRKVIVDPR